VSDNERSEMELTNGHSALRESGPERSGGALRWPDLGDDRGVSAVEVVIFTPLLVGFMLFVVALGSIVDVRGEVYGAARDAAREATRQRDAGTAMQRAQEAAEADLGNRCNATADRRPVVRHAGGVFEAGGVITIEVSCTIDLSGLSWVGLGTTKTVTGSSTAPIDTRRRFG
jgi:hypothetical protein